ncbi:hypothetical protein RI054_11g56980 [Pseudoscourfieldia marina]
MASTMSSSQLRVRVRVRPSHPSVGGRHFSPPLSHGSPLSCRNLRLRLQALNCEASAPLNTFVSRSRPCESSHSSLHGGGGDKDDLVGWLGGDASLSTVSLETEERAAVVPAGSSSEDNTLASSTPSCGGWGRELSSPSSSVIASIAAAAAPKATTTTATAANSATGLMAPNNNVLTVAATIGATAIAVANVILLAVALPTLRKFNRAIDEARALVAMLRAELPDTLAAVQLTGLEVGEAAEELGELGAEVGYGVRTAMGAARAATATTQSISLALRDQIVPQVQEKVLPVARQAFAERLQANAAEEEYTLPVVKKALVNSSYAMRAAAKVAKGARVAAYLRRVRRDLGGGRAPPPPRSPPPL